MMKTLGFDDDGIVVLIDSDMFLIKQFRELGFRDTITDLIVTKKVQKWSEFLLIDTFFYTEGSSGYGKMGPITWAPDRCPG